MISGDEVERLALLARLALPANEREALARELGAVLDYVGQLAAAPLPADDAPTAAAPVSAPLGRPDEGGRSLVAAREDLLAQAPERQGDYFRVPKVL